MHQCLSVVGNGAGDLGRVLCVICAGRKRLRIATHCNR